MTKERILVADDEPRYRVFIQTILRSSDYEVLAVEDGQAAVEAAAARSPALVLLDVRMPKLDGLEACRRIREFSTVPIIMLTALAEAADVVAGLEAGADDYITKPFVHEVLLARVRAALRRSELNLAPCDEPVFEAGGLRIDYARRQVRVSGREVHLTPTEYQLLASLAHVAGRVVVHADLLDQVWGSDHAGEDDLVRKVVHRLRQKIEPDPAAPSFVMTEGGVGYFLNRRA
jgi:two-component system, OmpR family, KDP operon response regulator KdpE